MIPFWFLLTHWSLAYLDVCLVSKYLKIFSTSFSDLNPFRFMVNCFMAQSMIGLLNVLGALRRVCVSCCCWVRGSLNVSWIPLTAVGVGVFCILANSPWPLRADVGSLSVVVVDRLFLALLVLLHGEALLGGAHTRVGLWCLGEPISMSVLVPFFPGNFLSFAPMPALSDTAVAIWAFFWLVFLLCYALSCALTFNYLFTWVIFPLGLAKSKWSLRKFPECWTCFVGALVKRHPFSGNWICPVLIWSFLRAVRIPVCQQLCSRRCALELCWSVCLGCWGQQPSPASCAVKQAVNKSTLCPWW